MGWDGNDYGDPERGGECGERGERKRRVNGRRRGVKERGEGEG